MEQLIKDEPTILELLPFVKWKTIKRAIKYYYPDDKNDYEGLFGQLKTFKKRKPKNKDERIEICSHNDAFYFKDEDMWSEWYSIHTNQYSFSFREWRELVNIPISKETIKHYAFTDILAFFIWEITFYGTEKNSLNIGNEMHKRVNEIKNEH